MKTCSASNHIIEPHLRRCPCGKYEAPTLKEMTLETRLSEATALLEKSKQYLKAGKKKFTPNTTNSLVDELIADLEKFNKGNEK